MNKRGVHEHHGILVMLALGLLAVGLLLYSAGIVDLSTISSGTAGLTGLAGGQFGTQEEPFSATPAPNQPPTYTGGSLTTPIDTPLVVDLAPLFNDPEGDALTFLATSEDQVSVDITDSTATFTPAAGFAGERTITIAVSDGINLLREPVRLTVGDASATEFATPTPEEQQATEEPANETLPPPEPPAEPSFGTQDVVTNCDPGPVVINTSTTLTNSISSNGTCISFGNNNTILDCAGFTILYNANGGDTEFGVTASNLANITIMNCIIRDINASATSGFGITFSGTNHSHIINNTIQTNGTITNYGLNFIRSSNNTIANNTINTQGSDTGNRGIVLDSNSSGNRVLQNTIRTNGTSSNWGIGLSGTSNNNTIWNNSIATNGSANFNVGINILFSSSGNNISHTTITTDGTNTNHGIIIQSSSTHNLAANNSITTHGSTTANYGVYLLTLSDFNNVTENTIAAPATSSNNNAVNIESSSNNIIASNRISGGGIVASAMLLFDADYQTIINNEILVSDGSDSYGIYASSGSDFNNFTRNNITTLGASSNTGIRVSGAQNNTLAFNKIITNGTSSHGIESGLNALSTSGNDNNVTTNGSGSYGISIINSNYTSLTNTILSDPVAWISTAANTLSNFTNTTFSMPNGSITSTGLVQINGIADITKAKLNVTFNRAYLNSTNLTFLNTTGIVTLNGITALNPQPMYDFEDDGTSNVCTSTADPFCTELGYSGGVFVFNTSHFTTFNSSDAASLSGCATINTSSVLTQNVTASGSCITFGADNIALDCAGFNITYGTGGSGEVFGINISNRNNVTVRNCGVFKGSALGARAYGIAYFNSSNGTLFNNTIRTNGTEENDGIHTGIPSSVNVTFAPTAATLVTNDGNVNNPFCTNATGVSLCQTCFDTGGVDCAFLGQGGCSDGEGYKADNILKFNLTNTTNVTSGNIQVIGGEAVFCNLNGNTTISFGTRNNCGSFRSATFSGEFFVAGENNLTCFVSGSGKDEDNGFKLVSFSYEGTVTSQGLAVTGNATTLNITGNTIVADGGPNSRGIFLDAHNSLIAFNRITTAGGNESHGIMLGAQNTTVTSNNITTADGGKSRGVAVVAPFSNVTNNNISIIGSSEEREGVFVLANRTNILFNHITTISGRFSHGISIQSGFFTNATGNNISVGAGNGSHGILIASGNADVTLNNVSVNTSSLSHGITLTGSVATGNAVTGNVIRANSRGSNALNVVSASGNTFSNNQIILANLSSAYLERALANTFASSTLPVFGSSLYILQDNGTINYTQALSITISTLLSQVVNIGHNRTFVNATHPGGSQLNGTAMLRFFSLPGDGVIPVFDDADDGTFDVCGGSRCRNTTYNQSTGILQYNVTHFTTYAAQEVSACATIDNLENATTVNATLTNNISGNADCLDIRAENVSFNCQGFTIFYDSTGAGGDGLQIAHTTNVLVENCTFIDISSGGAGGIGINITNSSNVVLRNNTIRTNGTNNNYGILARAFNATTQTNFTFINNTILTRGSANNNTGINIQGGNITTVIIQNNTITTNGTDSNDGVRIAATFPNSITRDVRAIQNHITTNGSSFRNNGILAGNYISSSAANVHTFVIANNTIRTFSASSINNGIYFHGTVINASVLQNNISTNTTTGGSSNAILMEILASANRIENVTILNNTLRTTSTGTDGIGIELENFAGGIIRNLLIALNTIVTNGTSGNDGLEITGASAITIENNTIITSGNTLGNVGIDMATSYANITIRTNLINTTGTGFDHGIAASGGIDPENITIVQNNITVGSHRVGSASSSLGNNRGIYFTSITGSLVLDNFIYTNGSGNNTGIFVGYDSTYNTVANNTIVTGGNESENAGIGLIQVDGEFGEIASNNVTNNTINTTGYGRSPSKDIGILLLGVGNSGTVNHNTIRINTVHARGNDSDNYGVALIGAVQYNNITSNQLLTNGTDRNHGIYAFSVSTSFQVFDNIIEHNNISAWGTASTDNYGIFLHNLVIRNNITRNNITTHGSDRNHGIVINSSSNLNIVTYNNFTLETHGTDNTGAIIQGSANNTFTDNIIQTNNSPLDLGIVLRSFARSNRISNNSIRTNGTVLTLSQSETNVIRDQNLTARSFANALLIAGSSRNNFTNVIIASDRGVMAEFRPSVGDGTFFDGFEDGTISPFTTSGNAPWLINNTNVSAGSFSAQAADINDSQSAVLTLSLNAGAGTISFARQVSSESGFDFLRFAIDGTTQQSWSGSLPYATFNFTFGSANTFTWTYSKDSSVTAGLDTAWVDSINISFAGNGSINNTFNRTLFFTNNTWLFIGENNTNNTVDNTTFTGPNGSLTIIPFVHLLPGANATIGQLNNTHNLTFLNSSNLTFFNTAAILRFLQILFIDPAPFRDLEDDGTFGYCPPSRCAELAYIGGEFIYNTSGFSFYAVAEGQVNLSINKTDSPDPVPASSQLNYTIVVNNSGSSTAFNLTLLEIYPPEVIFLSAQPTPEPGTNNTFFIGNFTPESQIVLNITVFVRNVTADIFINNTINATFLNQSNVTIRANVTESTQVTNPAVLNMSTVTISKTDSPDPVNTSGTLTYVINVTGTGPGIARNVSVNDTYPPQVIFISAQPTPITGTNNTFFLGNITNGTSVLINITVLVLNVSNGTIINNSANVTFQNNTNFTFTAVATASTTVINDTVNATPPAPAPSAGGSGGGWTTPTVGGVQLEQPVQQQTACIENWACDDWSACSLGRQSRTCYDQNQCNTTQYVPVQARTCLDLAPPAPEPEEAPLALPDIKVEQEAPTVETPRWNICAVMPLIVDGALLVLAVLVLLYLILTARQRAEKYWRTILDAAAGIVLALLIVQYVTCEEFLPLQYGVFILLALFVLLMRLADHLKASKFTPYTPPAKAPRASAPAPEPDRAELPPLRITKPAKVPANLKALTAAVKRNEKTMQEFLKVLKKK
jgi:hypothetical protein